MIAETINDVRYALRMLTKNPAFAGVVVLTLALGIGANAAIFSLLDQVLLQRLPVANPDQLVVLSAYDPKEGPDTTNSTFSYGMYQDLRDRNSVFSGVIARGGTQMNVTYTSSDYFKALEIPLVAGRDFDQSDRIGAPKVVIVNEKLAKHFFGTTDVIGKRIGMDDVPDRTIIGVVKDAQYVNLRENIRRHIYVPITQESQLTSLTLHVKTATEPQLVAEQLRAELKSLDPHLPLYNIKTLATQIDESLTQERLVTWLCAAFGVLATLLTALGLYGVLTFSVARRTREIGIRVALGAQRSDVFRLVMMRGVILVAVGVAIGVAASIGFSRALSSLLFGVNPNSLATLVGVSAGLVAVALLACYLPARRAIKVDPMVALRYE